MDRVSWIAVDEQMGSDAVARLGEALAVVPGAFDAIAVPLVGDLRALPAACARLHTEFGVAVLPWLVAEEPEARYPALAECIERLARLELLDGAIIVAITGSAQPALTLVHSLKRRTAAVGKLRFGCVGLSSRLATPPKGLDFVVDWPAPAEPLAMAVRAATPHSGDRTLAPSVLFPSDAFEAPAARLWLESSRRFVANRTGLVYPAVFVRLTGERLRPPRWLAGAGHGASASSWLSPRPAEHFALPAGSQARIAMIVHLHYPDLWPEFLQVIRSMPEPVDVFISAPWTIVPAVRAMVRRDVPDAVVFGVRNLGRDVVPFLQVLRAVGVDRYRYLLKLHSKKSAHVRAGDPRLLGGGDSWRRQAIAELAGSRSRLQQLLGMMDAEPSIGMVAAKGHLLEQGTWVGATGNLMACLHHRLGIAPAADVFPAGTMFWVRPSAIAKLVDLAPGLLDFEREAGQIDGTLHHALERSLAHLAVAAGYRVTDTSALSV